MMTKKLLIILLLIPHLEASELNLQQICNRYVALAPPIHRTPHNTLICNELRFGPLFAFIVQTVFIDCLPCHIFVIVAVCS